MKHYKTKAFEIDIRESESERTICTLSICLVLFIDESKYKIASRSIEFKIEYSSFNGFAPSSCCEYWDFDSRSTLEEFLSYFMEKFNSVEHCLFIERTMTLSMQFKDLLKTFESVCSRFVALGKNYEAKKYSSTIGKHLVEYGYLIDKVGRITTFDRLKKIEI